jgi:hypothetical protein
MFRINLLFVDLCQIRDLDKTFDLHVRGARRDRLARLIDVILQKLRGERLGFMLRTVH